MKLKAIHLKRFLAATVMSCMIVSVSPIQQTYGAQWLYDQKASEPVTKGVYYEFNHRLTVDGWQDIHVLTVDLTATNVRLAPIESTEEYGKKDTVLNMVNSNGALAGVNADFFGMKGNYSASFGPVVKDNKVISAGTDRNIGKNEYSTFFLDTQGNPFIDFFRIQANFLAGDVGDIELASINKITEMIYPIYFDRNAASSTADLDKRFPELVKYVIENDVITKISQKGETVEVPENGYLIILSGKYADDVAPYFAVGQKASLKINASLDLSTIHTAVSGVGKILENGQLPQDPGLIIKGRQPRTALGISQDKSKLILMVVDGRTHSIGATHEEMAALMTEYGAYDAMHFDGGGSSTMVVKTADENTPEVKNTVSDGGQRKVMNGLGVFSTAEQGPVTKLVIRPIETKAFLGSSIGFELFGYDEFYHKIPINANEIQMTSTDVNGIFQGTSFIPGSEGKITVTAQWNQLTAEAVVEGMNVAAITPNSDTIHLQPGQTATIGISGVSTEGFEAGLSGGIAFEVSDPGLGSMQGNVFTAANNGSGYIKCSWGNASCYIAVSVGGNDKLITSFEGQSGISFTSYPDTVTGNVGVSENYYNDGKNALALAYNITASDQTQAAYLNFDTPLLIEGEPNALKLSVYGNQTGHWVRAKIKDKNGRESVIDFTRNMEWEGWKELSANIPEDVVYPISLQTIYTAAVSSTANYSGSLYFDKLIGVYPMAGLPVPEDTKVIDNKQVSFENTADGSYYINMVGGVSSGVAKSPELYESERAKVHNALAENAGLAVYAGKNDVQGNIVDTIRWSPTYQYYNKDNVSIVQLTASKGGLRATFAAQWLSFKSDVLNSPNKNVIFIMDKTPSNFSDAMEAALFQSALNDIREAGKTIFIVSTGGSQAWNTVKDGVRYINLPNLWQEDGSMNPQFKMLKFKVNADTIQYNFVDMY